MINRKTTSSKELIFLNKTQLNKLSQTTPTLPADSVPVTETIQSGSKWQRLWSRPVSYYGLVFLGALLLAILYTWPTILHPGQTVPGDFESDQDQNIWSLWWLKHSLLDLHSNPFSTDYLFYPDGAKLYLYALNPLSGLLALPITALFGPVVAYSLTSIGGIALTGLAATAFCYTVSGSRVGGVVAGYALTFSVLHFNYVGFGQLEFIAMWPFLLYLTFLVRLLRPLPDPQAAWPKNLRQSWGSLLGATISLLVAGFVTLYYVSFAALFTLLFVGFRLLQVRQWNIIFNWVLRVATAWIAFGLIFAPYALKVFQAQKSGASELAVPQDVTTNQSVAPPSYFTFFDGSSVIGQLLGLARQEPHNFAHYLGYSLLILAVLGVWLAKRGSKPWPWLATGLVFALLSFGPILRWETRSDPTQTDPEWFMPWNWFHATPLLSLTNNPMRCELLLLIGVAAGAAIGIRELLQRWQRPVVKIGLALLLIGLILESAAPALTRSITVTPQVSVIQADCAQIQCGNAAVLDLPFSKDHYLADANLMLWGALRQEPIMGGYLSRRIADPYDPDSSPFRLFRQLSPLNDIFQPGPNDSALQILNYYNIRYITVDFKEYERIYGQPVQTLVSFLEGILGPAARIYSDDSTEIYRVPTTQLHSFMIVGDGWYRTETETPPKRWARQYGTFTIYSPQAQTASLSFETTAFAHARTVKVSLNGQLLQQIQVPAGSWQPVTLSVPLANGDNQIRLESTDAPQSPASLDPTSKDSRLITIAVRQVKLTY